MDCRKPRIWDWLLVLLCPMEVIAYHHLRAGISRIIILLIALISLALAILSTYSFSMAVASALYSLLDLLNVPQVESLDQLIKYFREASLSTNKIIFMQEKMWRLMLLSSLECVFSFIIIILAFITVIVARNNTRKLKSQYVFNSVHGNAKRQQSFPSPKGQLDIFTAILLPILSPSMSFAINSNCRLIAFIFSFVKSFISLFVRISFASLYVLIKLFERLPLLKTAAELWISTSQLVLFLLLGLLMYFLIVLAAYKHEKRARQKLETNL